MDDNIFGDTIYSYTRAQAIDDGELVDLTAWAKETGFTIPVACTRGVWASCIEWLDGWGHCQDERGRAHDVLFLLFCAIKAKPGAGDRIDFTLNVRGRDGRLRLQSLYSLCHGGDNAEPVCTIMLPDED